MNIRRAVRFLAYAVLFLAVPASMPLRSSAQIAVGISVRIGPPALPVYEQPICPGPGFMWTPGYWAWDDDDGYYWVPGTWVEAPEPGLLWTPGYWGWNDGAYVWNAGYWGPQVGFYGGINYGFGYFGGGFGGGEWRGGTFFYNTAVMHVDSVHITNVYVNKTVIVNSTSHVAFNGGQGGVQVRPTERQLAYAHETHRPPVAAQMQQQHAASQNRALFASNNHGRPAVAASARPGEFSGRGVVAARAAGGTYHAPKMSPKEARAPAGGGNKNTKEASSVRSSAPHNNVAHPSGARSNETKPAAHAAEKPSAKPAQKSATKPTERVSSKESAPKPATKENRATSKPAAAPKPAATPKHESAPKPAEHKASAPKESQPKPAAKESHPAPKPAAAPKHESAPKASQPRAEAKPAPSPKPSPAPKAAAPARASAPKPEHKGH